MAASCALAHRCVAVSPYVGRYLRARSHIGPEKLRVITNGVRFPRQVSSQERADVRAALGLTPEQLVIGCVGRVFNEHKRFSDVIDALAKLSRPDAALIIVGDGPDLNMLRRRAASLNLADRVKLVGRQADIAPYLGAMDIFVLSSSYEAFGLVIPEAMSAALPVVATRVDAVPDIVEEGVTGLLVPPRDPAALATALDELAASPERRLQMGLAGQQRAHDYFDESRYVRDVDAFYRELLS
jgi:glycosyltransferase involved in cell wall biosynthesis